MNANPITKITSWLEFLGKSLHLVGCAIVCVKSEVMLILSEVIIFSEQNSYHIRRFKFSSRNSKRIPQSLLLRQEKLGFVRSFHQNSSKDPVWNTEMTAILFQTTSRFPVGKAVNFIQFYFLMHSESCSQQVDDIRILQDSERNLSHLMKRIFIRKADDFN